MSGRAAALSPRDRFTVATIEEYPETQRWKKKLKASTWERSFRQSILEYCTFLDMSPTEIMLDRQKTFLTIGDEVKRRTHEEHYERFSEFIQELTRQDDKRKKLASWSLAAKLTAVRSFYKRNYYQLIEVDGIRGKVEKPLHIPTQEELGRMVVKCPEVKYSACMLAQAQSGMGDNELLTMTTWDLESPQYGSLRKQFDSGADYIHIHLDRGKTDVTFDSFFGPETLKWMRRPEFPKAKEGRVFEFSVRQWQDVVPEAKEAAGLDGVVTAHCLRKFFSNQLKLTRVGDPAWNNDLIEYWMGHALGNLRGAYIAPAPSEQMRLRRLCEERLMPIYPDGFTV